MSAWIVSHYHVNVMVSWAMAHNVTYEHLGLSVHVSPASAAILYAQNVRSVDHRYSEKNPSDFKFHSESSALAMLPAAILKACHCLDYQSCETEDYYTTEAHTINQAIQHAALRLVVSVPDLVARKLANEEINYSALPGYEDTPWGLQGDLEEMPQTKAKVWK